MNKIEAGRLGGLKTLARHGKGHYKRIGKLGAQTFWTRYTLQPVGIARYAIVRKSDNQIVNYING